MEIHTFCVSVGLYHSGQRFLSSLFLKLWFHAERYVMMRRRCCCTQASPFHFTGSFGSIAPRPSREQEVSHRAAHISFFRVLLLPGSTVAPKGLFSHISLCV